VPHAACLVPGNAEHQFAGLGNNRMLIIDFDAGDMPAHDLDLMGRLFSVPRYPLLDADFQHLLRYASAELNRFGSDPLLAQGLGGALLRALHLRLFEQEGTPRAGRVTWAASTPSSTAIWRAASVSMNSPRSPA